MDMPNFLQVWLVMMAVFSYDIKFWAEINIVNHVKEVLISSHWVFKIETYDWILSNSFSASMEKSIYIFPLIN